MIKRLTELRETVVRDAKGGHGDFINQHILEKEDFAGTGRYYALCTLAPGDSIGSHIHEDEMEVLFFISGTGHVRNDGIDVPVGPGDTNIVRSGEAHAVYNTGTENLVYTAIILYAK